MTKALRNYFKAVRVTKFNCVRCTFQCPQRNRTLLLFNTLLFIFLSTMHSKVHASEPASLTMAVYPWIPWRIQHDNGSWGGIAIDTAKLVALCTKTTITALDVKNGKRMRKEWGRRINVESAISPMWRQSQQTSSVYTAPLFSTSDIVFARKGEFENVKSVKDLYGERLGVTVGYYYPEGFTEAINAGKIRTSASNTKTLLPKLLRGRLKAIIINENELLYLLKQRQYKFEYSIDDFEVIYRFEVVPLHMRVHKDYEYLIPKFNLAIEELKKRGVIQHIQSNYAVTGKSDTSVSLSECPFKAI
ncbi:transporter substrate-binding domain-containing protein [Vibrio sp. S4M6]|uniref:substrate-binding periplasmic protein n=1 Tax=Vibrio sinus TaxID=2946865 RepID=UPI00202AB0CC|nr:transporter substrate-binding domain-containing protein [Vibrio sinus]MCL9783755.1 transporter substrate-binding domain-containing protein [Vibrio sinus]